MAGITLAQAEAKLTSAMTAYENALQAQEIGRGPVTHKNADLAKLQDAITYWNGKVNELSRSNRGPRVRSGYYDG